MLKKDLARGIGYERETDIKGCGIVSDPGHLHVILGGSF
jgi:hypothetical protein